MHDLDLKDAIKRIAVERFDRDGYHGTTIRNIAADAGCSLPMVYYYYKSKKELFHEIIKNDYFAMLKREAERLQPQDILDFYTEFILNVMKLDEHDKKIYRLGIKVYLSFDGDDELQSIMNDWEASIVPRHYKLILPHLSPTADAHTIVRAMMRLMEHMIESIVVKNRVLEEMDIRKELSLVLGREA